MSATQMHQLLLTTGHANTPAPEGNAFDLALFLALGFSHESPISLSPAQDDTTKNTDVGTDANHGPAAPFIAREEQDGPAVKHTKGKAKARKDLNRNPCQTCRSKRKKCEIVREFPRLCKQCRRCLKDACPPRVEAEGGESLKIVPYVYKG